METFFPERTRKELKLKFFRWVLIDRPPSYTPTDCLTAPIIVAHPLCIVTGKRATTRSWSSALWTLPRRSVSLLPLSPTDVPYLLYFCTRTAAISNKVRRSGQPASWRSRSWQRSSTYCVTYPIDCGVVGVLWWWRNISRWYHYIWSSKRPWLNLVNPLILLYCILLFSSIKWNDCKNFSVTIITSCHTTMHTYFRNLSFLTKCSQNNSRIFLPTCSIPSILCDASRDICYLFIRRFFFEQMKRFCGALYKSNSGTTHL